MKTIANTAQGVEEFGLICLTGEACGMWMRWLYDVTPSGKRLLEQYYGVEEIKLAANWNNSQGQIGSIMLTAAATVELCAFALLLKHDIREVFVFQGHVIGVSAGKPCVLVPSSV